MKKTGKMEEYKKTNADVIIRLANLADIDELVNICLTDFPNNLRWNGLQAFAKKMKISGSIVRSLCRSTYQLGKTGQRAAENLMEPENLEQFYIVCSQKTQPDSNIFQRDSKKNTRRDLK